MLARERERREREKRERERRERERERGQKEGGREGGGGRPGQKEEKEKTCAKTCARPVQVPDVGPVSCRQAKQEEEKRHPGRPPERRRRRRRGREGESKETPKPRNTTPAKKPAAFSARNLAKTLYPNNKAWPLKAHQ